MQVRATYNRSKTWLERDETALINERVVVELG